MGIKRLNEEVLIETAPLVTVGLKVIKLLKGESCHSMRRRIRLCAHKNVKDRLHEMFIVHKKGAYVRPHRHRGKVESVHIIEGLADLVVFNNKGNIIKVVQMGDCLSGKNFYCRIPDCYYHTLLIKSDFLVFHEIITGPFKKSNNVFPKWSPEEANAAEIKKFMRRLSHFAKRFLLRRIKK